MSGTTVTGPITSLNGFISGSTNLETAIKTVSDSSYTLLQSDDNKILDFTVGCTVTVPAGLEIPYSVGIAQGGVDQVSLIADNVILVEPDDQFSTEKRYVQLVLTAFSQDSFRLNGRTA